MNLYEHTIVAKQDLSTSEVGEIEKKYNEIINSSSGKVIKIEKWGLLNFARKIENYNKGFYIHYKFEGNKETVEKIKKNISIDNSVLRHLYNKIQKIGI